MSVLNKKTITLCDDDGNEYDAELPTKFEVCYHCDGHGHHSNPSIDGNGITSEEWANDWDNESRDMYLSGAYDVTCHKCNGDRVVVEVDEERLDADTLRHFLATERAKYEAARERESELKFGY